MNFKDSEFLLLVVAFLVGYFFRTIMKGCNVVEGVEDIDDQDNSIETRVSDLETLVSDTFKIYDLNFHGLQGCKYTEHCGMHTSSLWKAG